MLKKKKKYFLSEKINEFLLVLFNPFLSYLYWSDLSLNEQKYLIVVVYIFLLHYSVWNLNSYLSDGLGPSINIRPHNVV